MRRLVEKCFETCLNPDVVEVVFGIDDDDEESIAMAKKLQEEFSSKNIEYTVWPRKKYIFSDLMNQCSLPAKGDIFNLMSDDAHHDSKDWDKIAIDCFDSHPDKLILLQTSGGLSQKTGLPFMHKNWRTAAGYLLPPIFQGDWGDIWIADVIAAIGGDRFIYNQNITIRHLHAEQGQMEKDETYHIHYKERMEQEALGHSRDGDHPYHGWKGREMKDQEIEKLRQFIQNLNAKENK